MSLRVLYSSIFLLLTSLALYIITNTQEQLRHFFEGCNLSTNLSTFTEFFCSINRYRISISIQSGISQTFFDLSCIPIIKVIINHLTNICLLVHLLYKHLGVLSINQDEYTNFVIGKHYPRDVTVSCYRPSLDMISHYVGTSVQMTYNDSHVSVRSDGLFSCGPYAQPVMHADYYRQYL